MRDRQPQINGVIYDWQDQTTDYCSLEQPGGAATRVPTLSVEYR